MNYLKVTLVISMLLLVNLAKGQEFYDPETFSIAQLKSILENAYVDVLDEKETYIKIKDRRTFFVDLDTKRKRYILFNTNISCKEGTTKAAGLAYANKVNSELIAMQCYYNEEKNRIYYYHYWWIEGGKFTDKGLIKTLKFFDTVLTSSIQKDTESILK